MTAKRIGQLCEQALTSGAAPAPTFAFGRGSRIEFVVDEDGFYPQPRLDLDTVLFLGKMLSAADQDAVSPADKRTAKSLVSNASNISVRIRTMFSVTLQGGKASYAKKAWTIVKDIDARCLNPEQEAAAVSSALADVQALGALPDNEEEAYDTVAVWCNDNLDKFKLLQTAVRGSVMSSASAAAARQCGIALATSLWGLIERVTSRGAFLDSLREFFAGVIAPSVADADTFDDCEWAVEAIELWVVLADIAFGDASVDGNKFRGVAAEARARAKLALEIVQAQQKAMAEGTTSETAVSLFEALTSVCKKEKALTSVVIADEIKALNSPVVELVEQLRTHTVAAPFEVFITYCVERGFATSSFIKRAEESSGVLPENCRTLV